MQNIFSSTRNKIIAAGVIGFFAAAAADIAHAKPLSRTEQQVHRCILDSLHEQRMHYHAINSREFVVDEEKDMVTIEMLRMRPGRMMIKSAYDNAHARAFELKVRGTVAKCGYGTAT